MDVRRPFKKKSRKRPEKEKKSSAGDHVIPLNPLDVPLTGKLCLSVAHNGKLALVGGGQGLFLFDLEASQEHTALKTFYSENPVVSACWSPHQVNQEIAASACELEVSIWNIDHSSHPLLARFRAHQFPVHNVAWSSIQSNMFATCSASDSHIYFWDTRSPTNTPAQELANYANNNVGCTRVVWNPRLEHIVGTTHRGVARVWDLRKGILASFTAHRTPIDDFRWHPYDQDHFVTCSRQDNKLKFWSSLSSTDCLYNQQTSQPVHSVLYTPFGSGLITASETSIRLWKVGDFTKESLSEEEVVSVHTFSDSLEPILHLDWRIPDSQPNQLVSLGTDNTLRLWNMTPGLLQLIPTKAAAQPTTAGEKMGEKVVAEEGFYLDQEVKDCKTLPGIKFTRIDLEKLVLDVEICPPRSRPYPLRIDIPEVYPLNIVPLFTFRGNRLPADKEAKIKSDLLQIGSVEVERARPCLKICLQHLSENLAAITPDDDKEAKSGEQLTDAETGLDKDEASDSDKEGEDPVAEPVRLADESIICPRLCGASWTMQGRLVYFNNFPLETQRFLEAEAHLKKKKEMSEKRTKTLNEDSDEGGAGDPARKQSTRLESEDEDASDNALEAMEYLESDTASRLTFVLPRSYLDLRKRLQAGFAESSDSDAEERRRVDASANAKTDMADRESTFSEDSTLNMDVNSLMESISKGTQRHGDPQLGSSAALPLTEEEGVLGESAEEGEVSEKGGEEGVAEELENNKEGEVDMPDSQFFSTFFNKDAVQDPLAKQVSQDESKGAKSSLNVSVVIANVSHFLPVSETLARTYQLEGSDFPAICLHNAEVAKSAGRHDLSHSWTLASFITKPRCPGLGSSLDAWDDHPFGGELARHLLKAYSEDVQMWALLACVFEAFRVSLFKADEKERDPKEEEVIPPLPRREDLMIRTRSEPVLSLHPHHDRGLSGFLKKAIMDSARPGGNNNTSTEPERTSPTRTEKKSWHRTRGTSISQELGPVEEDEEFDSVSRATAPPCVMEPPHQLQLLPLVEGEDHRKMQYADYLSRIGAHQQRAELLKFCVGSRAGLAWLAGYDGMGFSIAFAPSSCLKCQRGQGRHTGNCGTRVLLCAVCRVSVRGLSAVCLFCQHGGHPPHIKSWFDLENVCPMGCGCHCRQNASFIQLAT